jgi:prepilin-type N-terminal cleavage/methylation domain-containing protein
MSRARATSCPRAAPAAGFSLLELVVVVVVISILLVIAIDKLLALRIQAERVAMEQVAGVIRSAIGIRVAESIVKSDVRALAALDGSNPMDRLSELPPNYLGALDAPDPKALPDGNWYFDRGRGELVYLVRYADYFAGASDPPRVRYAIRVVYTDSNKNGRYDPGAEAIEGVRLAVLEPYRWKQ